MSQRNKTDPLRTHPLNQIQYHSGPIIYWMYRDQRASQNWTLLYAQQLALASKTSLEILVTLRPNITKFRMSQRSLNFMLMGLEELEVKLTRLNIPLHLFIGDPIALMLAKAQNAGCIICDFSPLRVPLNWQQQIASLIKVPLIQVDTHNIVPVWHTSNKQEYAARTIRPKIYRFLNQFLTKHPPLIKHPFNYKRTPLDWHKIRSQLGLQRRQSRLHKSGEYAAHKQVTRFIKQGAGYHQLRNDPNADALSGLSPYLHFGHISPQKVALIIKESELPTLEKDAFLEELIVRRELADNYCYHNNQYDSFNGFPQWAQATLNYHRPDKRDYLYAKDQFESAATHDDLWNAAQIQLVKSGKMHGYLRMYWAKKILEWTESPEAAQQIAIDLNDRYSLDGRDPNGYTGIAWSIGGVHDRPWFERKVFGKIRYMNRAGADRKFNTKKFINTWVS